MAELNHRIADTVAVPTNYPVGRRRPRATRAWVGMDSRDEEKEEDEEARERGGVEDHDVG